MTTVNKCKCQVFTLVSTITSTADLWFLTWNKMFIKSTKYTRYIVSIQPFSVFLGKLTFGSPCINLFFHTIVRSEMLKTENIN